jgi:hypothetical protein
MSKMTEVVLGSRKNEKAHLEIVFCENYAQMLPTERILNLTEKPFIPKNGSKVYYSSEESFDNDIYKFMLACRASKNTENFYYLGSYKDDKKKWPQVYNIVSGDAIPPNLNARDKNLIFKYMMQGLHAYWIFWKRGLFGSTVLLKRDHSRVISSGKHYFQKDDSWVVNMSNIFIGLMIDYYQIKSGIIGVDSQIAFVSDSEYRFLVAKTLKSIFISFIQKQSTMTVKEEEDELIIKTCMVILKEI